MANYLFEKEARDRIIEDIKPIYKAVSETLGAGGKTVVFKNSFDRNLKRALPAEITKDGVTVARFMGSEEDANIGVELLLQASEKTNSEVGDSTTSTIVLAYNMLEKGIKLIEDNNYNPIKIKKGMDIATKEIIDKIRDYVTEVDDEKLFNVAMVSSNNDELVSKVVTDMYKDIGSEGTVTLTKGDTSDTYSVISDGISLDKGFAFQELNNKNLRFFTNKGKTHVLFVDGELDNDSMFKYYLRFLIDKMDGDNPVWKNDRLLVVANDYSLPVRNQILTNAFKFGCPIMAIKSPKFSEKRTDLMTDLAKLTGGQLVSEKMANITTLGIKGSTEQVKIDSCGSVLGRLEDVEVAKNKTICVLPMHESQLNYLQKVEKSIEETDDKEVAKWRREKLSILRGKYATLYVGGNSEAEQQERYKRVEDTINTVEAALKHGVVPGAGLTLYTIKQTNTEVMIPSTDSAVIAGYLLMYETLDEVAYKILENAAFDREELQKAYEEGYMINVNTGERELMSDSIIIDSAKAVERALVNSQSVAGSLLTISAYLTK